MGTLVGFIDGYMKVRDDSGTERNIFDKDGNLYGVKAVISPTRSSDAYAYGFKIDASDDFFTGGAATKSYLLYVGGDRPAGSAATGDSNDALIRASGNNYAENDTNFIFRGINISINNRSGGVLGRLEGGNIGSQGKSGGTINNIYGLTVTAENYGTVSDLFGGIDVILKNEAAVATTEFGIRISNQNNSIADAIAAGILFTDTGANTGFDYLIDGNGASVVVADMRMRSGMVLNNDKADRTMIGAVIGICNDAAPADNAPANGVVLYFDGTDFKAVNSAGATATLNNAAFS
jgi:hypothetical protein